MLLTHDQMRYVKDMAQSATLLHTESRTYPYLTRAAADVCEAATAFIACTAGSRLRLEAFAGRPYAGPEQAGAVAEQPEALWHAAMESSGRVFVVEDARRIERFAASPLVTGPQAVRFYANARLSTSDGRTIGALCVTDPEPRSLHVVRVATLDFLARQIAAMIEKSGDLSSPALH